MNQSSYNNSHQNQIIPYQNHYMKFIFISNTPTPLFHHQ